MTMLDEVLPVILPEGFTPEERWQGVLITAVHRNRFLWTGWLYKGS